VGKFGLLVMELNKALRYMGLYNKLCDISSVGTGL